LLILYPLNFRKANEKIKYSELTDTFIFVGFETWELLFGTSYDSLQQCLSNFRQSRTASRAVGAHADQLRKIPHTQKCTQVNKRNLIPVVKITITTFSLIKAFLMIIEGQEIMERTNSPTSC
jgi:hypothetical protein